MVSLLFVKILLKISRTGTDTDPELAGRLAWYHLIARRL